MYSVYLFHIPLFFKQQKKPFLWLSLFHEFIIYLFLFYIFLLSLNKKSQFPAYYHKNILPLFFILFFQFSFFVFYFSDFFLFFLFSSSSTYLLHSSPILRLCSILAPSSCRVVSFTCRVFYFVLFSAPYSLLPLHRSSPFFTYFFARSYSFTNVFLQRMFLGIQYDVSSLHTEYVN